MSKSNDDIRLEANRVVDDLIERTTKLNEDLINCYFGLKADPGKAGDLSELIQTAKIPERIVLDIPFDIVSNNLPSVLDEVGEGLIDNLDRQTLGLSPLQKHWDSLMFLKYAHLEMMAAAFMKKTDLQPDECELVQEETTTGTVFYFRKRAHTE